MGWHPGFKQLRTTCNSGMRLREIVLRDAQGKAEKSPVLYVYVTDRSQASLRASRDIYSDGQQPLTVPLIWGT